MPNLILNRISKLNLPILLSKLLQLYLQSTSTAFRNFSFKTPSSSSRARNCPNWSLASTTWSASYAPPRRSSASYQRCWITSKISIPQRVSLRAVEWKSSNWGKSRCTCAGIFSLKPSLAQCAGSCWLAQKFSNTTSKITCQNKREVWLVLNPVAIEDSHIKAL